ncbi:MAG: metal-dependent transcriptional regulator [Candidatus Micrarchaeia archaeon]
MKKVSPEMEEYLEAIYRKKEKGETATTKDISEALKVSKPSVTEMFRKLSEKGLIKYEPYKGAVLTKAGEEIGRDITRKHRLIEKLLMLLGVRKRRVHEEACALEHAVSDEVEKAIEASMVRSENDWTHGEKVKRLDALREGETGKVAFIMAGRSATRRLADMGLVPGTTVTVTRLSPMGGPIEVSVRGTELALGRGLASRIFVEVER